MVTKQLSPWWILLSIRENFQGKDQLIINWEDYCDKQVQQLS